MVIIGPAYPLRGGIAHFNESLANDLIKAGVDTEIVSFSLQYPAIFFPGKTQKETAPREVNVRIRPLINSVDPISWRRAARYIFRQNPDVVLIRFWLPFLGISLGALARKLRKRKVKVVALVDNAIPHESRPFDASLTRYFLRACDAFITLSNEVARDVKHFVPDARIHVHPHPLYDIFGEPSTREEACAYLQLNPEKKYILFFGFVRRYKGLDLLLEAFALSGLKEKGVELIVAGEFYEPRQNYAELLDKLDIESVVHVHDRYIDTSDVKHYFACASIVAQPYRTATQSGVSQIAYNFGRPMLVSNVGGLAEIVSHEEVGYVVDPEAGAIADALQRFFNENKEAQFSAAALERKHLFSWQHFTSSILHYLQEIKSS